MLSQNERRLIEFKEAVRIYHNCTPHCLSSPPSSQQRVQCFEQCSRKHRELADKLKYTLQYNIE